MSEGSARVPLRFIHEVRYRLLACNMLHVLSHRAYVEVLLLIVEHVRLMERILQELALHLRVELLDLTKVAI